MTESSQINYLIATVRGEDWKKDEYRLTIPSAMDDFNNENPQSVHLTLQDDKKPAYIRGRHSAKEGKTTDGYFKIYPGDRIQIAERWRSIFRKPLFQVAMEFYFEDDPHFRIYDFLDYALFRLPKLVEEEREIQQAKPVTAAAFGEFHESPDVIDVASNTQYSGQIIRIIPFDATHPLFPDQDASSNRTIDPEVLDAVVEQGRLPRCAADRLAIEWTVKKRGLLFSRERTETIYQDTNVPEVLIRLPEKGRFQITWQSTRGRVEKGGVDVLTYGHPPPDGTLIGDRWYGEYHSNPENSDELIVYLPYRAK